MNTNLQYLPFQPKFGTLKHLNSLRNVAGQGIVDEANQSPRLSVTFPKEAKYK